ncbi:MAG: acyl-CoA dehydrogenase, partial [Pseudonocardiales bacterium]|nr:acyl-CoA dehydrogenase [Pseudonocardiales bacterium]
MNVFETPERKALRETVRSFVTRDVLPHQDEWERAGELPRSLHERAAAAGLIGASYPSAVGGGDGDPVDALVLAEEFHTAGGSSGVFASLFTSGISLPHLVAAGDPQQIERWVRPTIEGAKIGSLAITEPDGGSDVANLRTTAKRDGS